MSVSVQEFLQFFLLGIIAIVVPVLGYQAHKFLQEKVAEVKSRLDTEQSFLLDEFVGVAVKAMEQAKLKEHFEGTAEELLEGATDIVQAFLDSRGMTSINVDEIVARIRAALRDGVHKSEAETEVVEVPIEITVE